MINTLYYGDNLDILREYIPDDSVDLIYLDPPFQSKKNYNLLFKEKDGAASQAQIKAFDDTWQWDEVSARTYRDIELNAPEKVIKTIQAFREMLGENDMLAYLVMMAPRLVELHRALKPTGSLYLHCDPTASHYLKLILDSVFGVRNFQNEIIWHYRRWTGTAKRFLGMHDIILFYTKNPTGYVFNPLFTPYTEKSLKRKQNYHTRIKGDDVYVTSIDEKGIKENDVWMIPIINPAAKERLGYPTQKPEKLLERVIQASSNEGDVILDPFSGCGTTVTVAQRLNRKWIGIDITHLATGLVKHRLFNTFGSVITSEYITIGEPEDLESAKTLAQEDRYQFEYWALGLVGAGSAKNERKKGADKGIDGVLRFHENPSKSTKAKSIILQVKSGHVQVSQIRDLKGVVEREKADMGVFITLEKPTRPMITEAAASGFYHSDFYQKDYPKIQIFTIEALLSGKGIDYPFRHNLTIKKAPRDMTLDKEQLILPEID